MAWQCQCLGVEPVRHIPLSGLKPLLAFSDLLNVFFQRFRESVKRAEWQVGIESHRLLVDLLATGRVAEATEELRKHIESHKERLP